MAKKNSGKNEESKAVIIHSIFFGDEYHTFGYFDWLIVIGLSIMIGSVLLIEIGYFLYGFLFGILFLIATLILANYIDNFKKG